MIVTECKTQFQKDNIRNYKYLKHWLKSKILEPINNGRSFTDIASRHPASLEQKKLMSIYLSNRKLLTFINLQLKTPKNHQKSSCYLQSIYSFTRLQLTTSSEKCKNGNAWSQKLYLQKIRITSAILFDPKVNHERLTDYATQTQPRGFSKEKCRTVQLVKITFFPQIQPTGPCRTKRN